MDVTYQDIERAREVTERTRRFIDDVVLPQERALLAQRDERSAADRHEEGERLVEELRDEVGIGRDLPLADFYENVRCFRIIDGADEVQLRSIKKRAFDGEEIGPEEVEHVTRFRAETDLTREEAE